MTHYEKMTLERFEESLSSGKYNSLTGARRAIGKSSGWTAKDKEKAQAIAEKHFGSDAPAAKPAKKAAAKAPKKAAVKAASKKAAAAPVTATAKRAYTRKASISTSEEAQKVLSHVPEDTNEAIEMGKQIVAFAGALREEAHKAKTESAHLDFTPVMVNVNKLLLGASELVQKSFGAAPQELPPQRVTAPSQLTSLVSPIENGVTSEERTTADLLRTAKPASSISELPRPVSQS